MRARCRYTWRRPDRTHGGVLNLHTGCFPHAKLHHTRTHTTPTPTPHTTPHNTHTTQPHTTPHVHTKNNTPHTTTQNNTPVHRGLIVSPVPIVVYSMRELRTMKCCHPVCEESHSSVTGCSCLWEPFCRVCSESAAIVFKNEKPFQQTDARPVHPVCVGVCSAQQACIVYVHLRCL